MEPPSNPRAARAGFTLLEVAVTIVIVGIGLTLVLQVLNTAQVSAAQTRNEKLARELGVLTLGRIASGLYQEEMQERFFGSYADEEHPDFQFEVALGEEVFPEDRSGETRNDSYYDAWNDPDRDRSAEEDEDAEEAEQPYERVKIKVSFPKIGEYTNHLILERWIPWKQAYGDEDEEEGTGDSSAASGSQP